MAAGVDWTSSVMTDGATPAARIGARVDRERRGLVEHCEGRWRRLAGVRLGAEPTTPAARIGDRGLGEPHSVRVIMEEPEPAGADWCLTRSAGPLTVDL
jgi:hypothetical protein